MSDREQPSILRMSDLKTLELVDLYEKESCLWNTLSEDYKNRHRRIKAVERIAKKLGIKNFEARHVIMKFKNLRNSYSQELKKIAKSQATGASDEEVYKPKVIWFDKMNSFLRPHLKTSRASHIQLIKSQEDNSINITIEKFKNEPETYYFEETETDIHMPDPEAETLTNNNKCDDKLESSEGENNYRTAPEIRKYWKRKRNHVRVNATKRVKIDSGAGNRHNIQMTQTLKNISNYLHTLTQKDEDHYDSFGRYVAALLRNMPPEQSAHLQPKIVSLITLDGINEEESA